MSRPRFELSSSRTGVPSPTTSNAHGCQVHSLRSNHSLVFLNSFVSRSSISRGLLRPWDRRDRVHELAVLRLALEILMAKRRGGMYVASLSKSRQQPLWTCWTGLQTVNSYHSARQISHPHLFSPTNATVFIPMLFPTDTKLEGRPIAQAVSRRHPTATARVRGKVRPCGICDGQSGT
jgi:hypothetical protein